jgi:hypothetical protein
MRREIALYGPAADIQRIRQDVLNQAPDLAGLTVALALNSGSHTITHYGGQGSAPAAQIEQLGGITGLVWAYVDEGSEGQQEYASLVELAGAFNLVPWTDPNGPT